MSALQSIQTLAMSSPLSSPHIPAAIPLKHKTNQEEVEKGDDEEEDNKINEVAHLSSL